TITTDVENYPGFSQTIQGPWLMEQMEAQAEAMGTKLITDMVIKAELSKKPFHLACESGDTYLADALVIATGAKAQWLGLESEKKFQGFGVSACATCDGFFYKGKEVMVVGGGNTAVEEAIYLTNFANKVVLVHRRDSLRAEKILQERLFANKKIEIIWDSELIEVLGDDKPLGVTGAKIKNKKTGEEKTFALHGIFIAIGHAPATELFKDQLTMLEGGYLQTAPNSTQTSIEGIYAAGDVADYTYRQAVTAAGMGCMAALEAEKWLAHKK
ncbi:MAG: NAD(P)/FAD-dependent oxidoreductase, partial [Parvibaculales bacterium]